MAYNLIEKMKSGDKNAIIDGLNHTGAIYRMNAISFSAIFGIDDPEVTEIIKELKKDDNTVDGYSVANFATAALHILNIERYIGIDAFTNNLIESRFDFLK